jgi:hypothetical protein
MIPAPSFLHEGRKGHEATGVGAHQNSLLRPIRQAQGYEGHGQAGAVLAFDGGTPTALRAALPVYRGWREIEFSISDN